MEIELRDLGNLDFFGLLKTDGDRERVMEQIDSLRAKTLYSHSAEDCSDACKDRGGKAVIYLSVLVFGTNQLNVSTLIYIIRILKYTLHVCIFVHRLRKALGSRWAVETNVCPLYDAEKSKCNNFFYTPWLVIGVCKIAI